MTNPTKFLFSDWRTDLEIGEAQATAGDGVPGEIVLSELKASIDRLATWKQMPRSLRFGASRRD